MSMDHKNLHKNNNGISSRLNFSVNTSKNSENLRASLKPFKKIISSRNFLYKGLTKEATEKRFYIRK